MPRDIEANPVFSGQKLSPNDIKAVQERKPSSRKVSILEVGQQEQESEDYKPTKPQDDSGSAGEKKDDESWFRTEGCCVELCRIMFSDSVLSDLP